MKNLCFLLLLAVAVSACRKEESVLSADIVNFYLKQSDNPSLIANAEGVIGRDTIIIMLPSGTNLQNLIPSIEVSENATVTPATGEKQDFSQPITYTVTSGSDIKSYVVVCRLSDSVGLSSFKINGADCAYSVSTHTFYYPVPLNSTLNNYVINFDTTFIKSVTFGDVTAGNNKTVNHTLTTNEEIDLQALDGSANVYKYKLIITGLPLIQIKAGETIGDDDVNGNFSIIDPEYASHKGQLQMNSPISISIRGESSRAYPKKSYSMHLTDAEGEDTDLPLLGLRNDNSWILDAMYVDQARMRNRLCTDIWNSFNNVPYADDEPEALNGTRGYMTEVFLNNEYLGLYCLTERLDRKQLKINKQYGKMYKADDWSKEVNFKGVSTFDNNSSDWGGWEFEYPEPGDEPAPDWSYLYNAVNFICNSSREDFVKQISGIVDVNNMADYYLFMNILDAQDNQSKNTFFSFRDSRNDNKFFYSVWDLDATFGRSWDGTYSQFIIGAGENNLLDRLIVFNPNNFVQLVKDRWNVLKNNQLSKSTVTDRIEAYRKLLVNTNAFAREKARWNNFTQDIDAETDYMKQWYSTQYDMLDTYIKNK